MSSVCQIASLEATGFKSNLCFFSKNLLDKRQLIHLSKSGNVSNQDVFLGARSSSSKSVSRIKCLFLTGSAHVDIVEAPTF